MTLVLTGLTERFIVQVSDRRLTWRDGSFKDGFVKAVVTPDFAISYTGVADLGPDRDTAKWIAMQLARRLNEDVSNGLNGLAEALTTAFRRPRYAGRCLAVVAVGWRQFGPQTGTPRMFVISNFDATGTRPDGLPGGVWPEFNVMTIRPIPGRLSSLFPIGQAVKRAEGMPYARALERLCISGRTTARAIVQLLTECIREVSRETSRDHDRRPPTVSEDVLAIALPRPDRCSGALVVGQIVDDWWSVTCIPAGESRRERQGGPIIVGDGAVIRALEPDEGPPGRAALAGGAQIILKGSEGSQLDIWLLTNPPLGVAWGWPGHPPPGVEAEHIASSGGPGNP